MDPTMMAPPGPPGLGMVAPGGGGAAPLVAMLAGIAQQAQMGMSLAQQDAAEDAMKQQKALMIAALSQQLALTPNPEAAAAMTEPGQVVSPPPDQAPPAQGGY